MTYITYLIIT